MGPAEAPARIWEHQLPEAAVADVAQRPPHQYRGRRQLAVVQALLRLEARLPRVVPAADGVGAERLAVGGKLALPPAVLRQRQPVAAGVEAAARQPRSNLNARSWIQAQR
jgi:hypothetical protein